MKTFEELYNLDISDKVKKHKGFDYLNWLDLLLLLRSMDMAPTYDVQDIKELSTGQIIVKVFVNIGSEFRYITYTDARSRDFEFIKQRAFVKCVAVNWGLGLKLWESEDAASDNDDTSERINKMAGILIGPKFKGHDDFLNYVFSINDGSGGTIGDKIGIMPGRDRSLKFGNFLNTGDIKDRRLVLKYLESLSNEDVF